MSVAEENLGGLYDDVLHAAMNQYTDKGTIYGTLCGSNSSANRRTANLADVTCPKCRARAEGAQR